MQPICVEQSDEERICDEAQPLSMDSPSAAAVWRGLLLRATSRKQVLGTAALAAGLILFIGAVAEVVVLFGAVRSASLAPTYTAAGELRVLAEQIVQCPGTVSWPGLNGSTEVQVVNAKVGHIGQDAGQMHLEGGAVVMHMEGRAYFADKCTDGSYNNNDYKSIPLLGKTVQFTVDMGGAGCGCNIAFYFVSMKQNTNPSNCNDFYCDANSVCGVPCAEVDVMEGNSLVWRSTLHLQEDDIGSASGYGGTGPHQQTWTKNEYGPGSSCIDTNKPFDVLAHFPMHDGGKFQGMMVDLKQEGSSCGGLTASVGWYEFGGVDALHKLTAILKQGMVPVVSYWKTDDLMWLDGNDVNGDVPCAQDRPFECPLVGPRVMNFQVSDFKDFIHESTMNIKPTTKPQVSGAGVGATGAYDPSLNGAGVTQATTAQSAVPAAGGVYSTQAAAGQTMVQNGAQAAAGQTMVQNGGQAGIAQMAPPSPAPAAAGQTMVQNGAQAVTAQAAAPAAVGVPPAQATVGWTVVQNGAQVYYYNTQTQQTAWSLPA